MGENMKKLNLILGVAGLLLGQVSLADDALVKKCNKVASQATKNFAGEGYDKDGFWAIECKPSSDGRVVVCQVAADKGNGAASDTYQVVLNKSCTAAFSVKLVGEE
jgi:hypothetical protein